MVLSKKDKQYAIYFILLALLFIVVGFAVRALADKTPLLPVATQTASPTSVAVPPKEKPTPPVQYIQIIDGCGPSFDDTCVNAYSKPSTDSTVVAQLRIGTILKTNELLLREGQLWYQIEFDEWLRYPERTPSYWYVTPAHVRVFQNTGIEELKEDTTTSWDKYILIDRSDQTLYAYEGDELFMKESVSTGLSYTPTPRGNFVIYKKTPTRYMQGPLPGISVKYYDLPGVPWNLYFTKEGGVIHGTYWHDKFGQQWSNGCVNIDTTKAERLYAWADIGTPVVVQD